MDRGGKRRERAGGFDDLQQDREQFPFDTYVLTLALIGLISLVMLGAVLPLGTPGFSFPGFIAEAITRTRGLYAACVQTLLF